jgi:hypothetical protein
MKGNTVITAFISGEGTEHVDIRGNRVYNHCLATVVTNSAVVEDNYIYGCDYSGITILTGGHALSFQVTNNTVFPIFYIFKCKYFFNFLSQVEKGRSDTPFKLLGSFYPTGICVFSPTYQSTVTDVILQQNRVLDYTVWIYLLIDLYIFYFMWYLWLIFLILLFY